MSNLVERCDNIVRDIDEGYLVSRNRLRDTVEEVGAEIARLRARVAELKAALQDGYELMGQVEASAIEHVLYDGWPVEEWSRRARAALDDKS
jgi:predicted RNase H-like nuclease